MTRFYFWLISLQMSGFLKTVRKIAFTLLGYGFPLFVGADELTGAADPRWEVIAVCCVAVVMALAYALARATAIRTARLAKDLRNHADDTVYKMEGNSE